ncbi:hypothetical protein SAMN00790413_05199 [Deinococcus hopiensis KR-140]|uniref:Uncharacterized protein n=1 Tax=Deinococcus hopiensis KR-140 TaxID=695939 RepID=A0A1W1UUA7_9DEIO|nr:hypothetical protein SAMN00790413_05199 [Deinococcus hopiensis KR-140]
MSPLTSPSPSRPTASNDTGWLKQIVTNLQVLGNRVGGTLKTRWQSVSYAFRFTGYTELK